jgi:hypothetical protein
VDAVNIGAKYRDTPVPLLSFENDLLGELGMSGLKNGADYGTDDNQRFLYVVNAPHPLAARRTEDGPSKSSNAPTPPKASYSFLGRAHRCPVAIASSSACRLLG